MLLTPRQFMLSLFLAAGTGAAVAGGASDPAALATAQAIAARPANEGRVGTMHFAMRNGSGDTRQREALMFHSDTPETIRIAIFFTQPAMISDTAFLTFDHRVGDDENWLYLPATGRVRRLPVSDRGDYFMGTDLSYGDIKDDFKFGLEDWIFTSAREETVDGIRYARLEGEAQSARIIAETGYSRFTALIDTERNFPVDITYLDADGDPLKHIVVEELDTVGGAWTAMRFTVDQLQSGHTTVVYFTDMQHRPHLDDSVFDAESLAYGVPYLD
ncbi:outer membrane lipoprotein-sorting protein [Chromatocurvus halotolerans]|uniref:Outer membrane lipoprotein-sorting protein n=1 Tax=Chromatocurvus halotolerans TaxID=1132028 RepID=A0A4R2KMX2_9GAMM|nr:outer membrane lipoprotein-sorting protein [Chromatocurvus halotolerans]TCO75481.1 outer membrane lipoprotein-sorting protein [Chromatocurvus halotolerans]